MLDDPRRQRRKGFWDQRVGYGTRRGCLIWFVVVVLLPIAVMLVLGFLLGWPGSD